MKAAIVFPVLPTLENLLFGMLQLHGQLAFYICQLAFVDQSARACLLTEFYQTDSAVTKLRIGPYVSAETRILNVPLVEIIVR